jgi:methionyl aminopeptidase
MITIKSESEFEKMVVAGRVVAEVHAEIRNAAKAGVTLKTLDEIAEKIIRDRGCEPSFLHYQGTYPASICASPNDVIVHGIPTGYRLRDGDILAIDVGAIYQGLHGDAAFTMGIGDISPQAQRLIDVTEEGMWAGISKVKHGARVGDIGAAVEAVGRREDYGVVREYVGHGIGRAMHEEPQIPNYGTPGKGMKLRKGMAICIEPMFNLGTASSTVDDDNWTVRTADGQFSAHWEHTVAITRKNGVIVTTLPEGVQPPVPVG